MFVNKKNINKIFTTLVILTSAYFTMNAYAVTSTEQSFDSTPAHKTTEEVIIAGHSMGGGISLRYSMKEGLKSVKSQLLVIAGENDEAFNASAYKEAIETYSEGVFHIIAGQTHNGMPHDVLAMEQVKKWVNINRFIREVA